MPPHHLVNRRIGRDGEVGAVVGNVRVLAPPPFIYREVVVPAASMSMEVMRWFGWVGEGDDSDNDDDWGSDVGCATERSYDTAHTDAYSEEDGEYSDTFSDYGIEQYVLAPAYELCIEHLVYEQRIIM